ncbi:MAG: PTS mannose transporter subunit IIA [Neisseriaceae bacterium]
MVSLLIVTHYSLGDAYRAIISHFYGQDAASRVRLVSSGQFDTKASLAMKIERALLEIPDNQSVLILADVLGATPCNVLKEIRSNRKISMLTGLNVPMLVKAFQDVDRIADVRELAERVLLAARNGIMLFDLVRDHKC